MKFICTLLFLFHCCLYISAQSSLKGKLTDAYGCNVPFVEIVLSKEGEKASHTQSGENGRFRFNYLRAGVYTLTITSGKYSKLTSTFSLGNSGSLKLSFILNREYGCYITVTRHPLLNRSDTRQHTTFGSGQLRRMPIRNLHN